MRLGLPRPGTVKHRLASFVAVAWIGLLAGFGGPEAYRQVHDHYSLQPCAEAFVTAMTDRDIAKQHIPPSHVLNEILDYIIPYEQVFADRIKALDCPTSVQDEIRDLNYRMDLWMKYLARIREDNSFYEPTWVAIRSSEIGRAADALTNAIAELMPKPETGNEPA